MNRHKTRFGQGLTAINHAGRCGWPLAIQIPRSRRSERKRRGVECSIGKDDEMSFESLIENGVRVKIGRASSCCGIRFAAYSRLDTVRVRKKRFDTFFCFKESLNAES